MYSHTLHPFHSAMLVALSTLALPAGQAFAADDSSTTLPGVTVRATRPDFDSAQPLTLGTNDIAPLRSATSDTAQLLNGVPGVGLYSAGGVSSMPFIQGMADDRLRIKVDGMDLISACANHMNPPLSYIDPTAVGSIQVYAGVVPVSVGGDSLGGAIVVSAPAPEFASSGEEVLLKGEAGAFYRSNGNARGANVSMSVANERLSVTYRGSSAESGNYEAAADFKSGTPPTRVKVPAASEVGSSMYSAQNQSLALATRHENHLLELKLGLQNIPYQGFPNQRMDMTGNKSEQINLRYQGQHDWGVLEARVYEEHTRHKMNFLDNKLSPGALAGMPMDTEGRNTGVRVQADFQQTTRDRWRVGTEYQRYRLNDWWDPTTSTTGMMGPNVFWNINEGKRDRWDLYAEWDARWAPQWQSQLGVRRATVSMDTGPVQGYNTSAGMMGYGDPANPASVPGAFNAADRKRTDENLDLSALMKFTADESSDYTFGMARKSRSPNLYERYTWSTNNAMAMNMVNWFGDANGYVGNLNLKPETANTVSLTADWHDPARQSWSLRVAPYLTYVQDYIDAAPCATAGKTCPARTDGFVNLSFANQSARIHGVDVSGHKLLVPSSGYGSLTARAVLSYVRGKNADTDDNLYNQMPLNAKLTLVQRLGAWANTAEVQLVADKKDVSQVRNEMQTGGYGLLNLRSSYEWKSARLDMGIDNVLNRLYAPPLGGAYVGQGGAVWGTPVPGPARSFYVGLSAKF